MAGCMTLNHATEVRPLDLEQYMDLTICVGSSGSTFREGNQNLYYYEAWAG